MQNRELELLSDFLYAYFEKLNNVEIIKSIGEYLKVDNFMLGDILNTTKRTKLDEYHDVLFKNLDTWSPQTLSDATNSFVEYAGQLGMSTDEFKSCLESERHKKGIEDDMSAGDKAQVGGTPAFFINGKRLVGAQPFSEFEAIIEQELKK